MPRVNLPENRFYVYALLDGRGHPFYVGKGCYLRWMDHIRRLSPGYQRHKDNIIAGMLRENIPLVCVILEDSLTDPAALAAEIRLIKAIGRRPHGPLVNQTDGGDGWANPSTEARAKVSRAVRGRAVSEETKAKMRASNRNWEPAIRARISAARMGIKPTPETREKLRVAAATRGPTRARGYVHSPETRRRISEGVRRAAEEGTMRHNQSIAARRRPPISDATREKMAAARRGRKMSEDTRQKLIATNTGRKHTEESKKKISEARKHTIISNKS